MKVKHWKDFYRDSIGKVTEEQIEKAYDTLKEYFKLCGFGYLFKITERCSSRSMRLGIDEINSDEKLKLICKCYFFLYNFSNQEITLPWLQ